MLEEPSSFSHLLERSRERKESGQTHTLRKRELKYTEVWDKSITVPVKCKGSLPLPYVE